MTAQKIFSVALILITVATVFTVFARAEDEPVQRFVAREIEHCRLEEGYTEEKCNVWGVVVGHAYELTLAPDMDERETGITFPVETEATENDYIPRAKILCNDPEGIAIAKLDQETWKWEILPSSYIKEEGKATGQYRLGATVASVGIYAVIVKDQFDNLRIKEFSTEGKTCQRLTCGSYKGFEIDSPYSSGNVPNGTDITMNFCKIIYGCDASEDGTCSRACPQGVDPNCPGLCTPDEDKTDCCVPVPDGFCDPDCWTVDPEGNPAGEGDVIRDSTDPDCLMGKDAELYTEDSEPEEVEIFTEKAKSMETDSSRWTDNPYVESYDTPMLFQGSITLQISGPGVVFFKNFTYTDLNGTDHLLFPLNPAVRANYASPGHEEFLNDRAELVYFPHIWYQREADNEIDGEARVQFDLPPTGIKKFSVYAIKRNVDSAEVSFTFTGAAYENADPDEDNSSNYDDCNDNNPLIHPGAEERCNSVDDNCNGYRSYNTAEEEEPVTVGPWYSAYGGDCGDYSWEGPDDDTVYIRDKYYRMPCDGYLEFTSVVEGAYLEVWQKQACESCEGIECITASKTMGEHKTISCDAAGLNGPWNKYSAIFAKGDDVDDDPGFGCCYESGNSQTACDDYGCAIGAHASCRVGAMPDIPRKSDGTFDYNYGGDISNPLGGLGGSCKGTSYFGPDHSDTVIPFPFLGIPLLTPGPSSEGIAIVNQQGTSLGGFGTLASTNSRELNSEQNRVRLNESDMVWARIMDWGDGLDNCGAVQFKVHCYKQEMSKQDPEGTLPTERQYVDEGLFECVQKTPMMTINICPAPKVAGDLVFNKDERKCIDNPLCPPDTTQYGNFSCLHNVPAAENPGIRKFEAYACPEGENCFKFYSGSYNVCLATEQCSGVTNPELNIDLDCDGLVPFELTSDGKVDYTKAKDPDCADADITGQCDYAQRKWYDAVKGWQTEGYCQQCGTMDSTCAISCEADEKSCEGGCREGTCDIAANKLCKNGMWTEASYCSTCGKNDTDCFEGIGSLRTCTSNACDVVYNKTCFTAKWMDGNRDERYCNVPTCRGKDADCAGTCVSGTCDVNANKFCTSTGWSNTNYCEQCGAVDADCGTKACEADTCDTTSHKVCAAGEWKIDKIEYCRKCSEADRSYCLAECGDETSETDCSNGIDDDCNGFADCQDTSQCPSTLPECSEPPCTAGATRDCGTDVGYCQIGSQTCGFDGKWSECAGSIGAATEVCNGIDDNCDSSVDEGCDCTSGEVQECGADRGACSAGVQRCRDGRWSRCFEGSGSAPKREICNDGIDNDCDGLVEEGCPCTTGANQTCGITAGVCSQGKMLCVDSKWGECTAVGKLSEGTNYGSTCSDGLDNDCDGKADSADDGCTVTAAANVAPSCTDLKKNQDEEDIDCGGSKCQPCVKPANCHNRVMDPAEQGVDCGGECSVECSDDMQVRAAPSDTTTDADTTAEPECGDDVCEGDEDFDLCPDDCPEEGSALTGYLIPIIIVLVLLGLGFGAYKAGIIKVGGKGKPKQPDFPSPRMSGASSSAKGAVAQPRAYIPPSRVSGKEIKTKEELELEKSMREEKELLKK